MVSGRLAASARLITVAAAVLLLGLAAAGCSPVTRYRVLSFFFDGVPPPKGMKVEVPLPEPSKAGGPQEQETGDRSIAPPPKPPPAPRSVHAPYRTRACSACHTATESFNIPAPVGKLCGQCHQPYVRFQPTEWAHGPVAAQDCSVCHLPHRSDQQSLLTAAEPDLCFTCHDASRIRASAYHQAAGDQACSLCHDPHWSGNRLLLANAATYARRGQPTEPAPSPHAAWSKQDCAKCHMAENSNVPIEGVDAVCLTCHANVQNAESSSKMHRPVSQGQCTLCHTPHNSPRPHLIKPLGEKICYECHDADETRTPSHPPMEQADCLICHTGHQAERPHMLKPGIPPAE